MQTEYLDKFLMTLPSYARAHIQDMISDRQAPLSSEEVERLIQELGSSTGRVLMQPRYQEKTINSEAYNATLKEVYTDLYRLFMDYNRINAVLYDHHRLNTSLLRDIARQVEELERQIAALFATIRGAEGYRIGLPMAFARRAREEELYTLRSGERVESKFVCNTNGATGELTLPVASEVSRTLAPNGTRLATAVVTRRPAGVVRIPGHDVTKAIDNSDSTFYGEVVLADVPLAEDGFAGKFAIPIPGACSTFEIIFDRLTYFSEILFRPYAEYPIDIVRVRAYETAQAGARYTDVVPAPSDYGAVVSIDRPRVIRFPRVRAARLEFDIAQRHFVRNIYTVREDEVTEEELWSCIGEYELTNLGMTYMDQDMVLLDPSFALYKNALKFWEKELLAPLGLSASDLVADAAGKVLPDDEAQSLMNEALALQAYRATSSKRESVPVEVAKYEYTYGFYDISPRDVAYRDTGVWVSESLPVEHNIRSLRLSVEDEQAEREIAGEIVPVTSAEWYVRVTSDWIPVLPEKESFVRCEILDLQPDGTARTRFVPGEVLWVREQGVRITRYTVQGDIVAIEAPRTDAVYTISYVPASDCQTVDLLASPQPMPVTEVFPEVPGTRIVKLSHYPFIDYARLNLNEGGGSEAPYMPIRASLRGDLTALGCDISEVTMFTEPRLCNTTDYLGGRLDTLMTFEDTNHSEFQFVHDGKSLAFAQRLPAELTVEYQTLVTDLRVKVVLRRALPSDLAATHVVKSCVLKMRTFGTR